jgi:hypothetical protein
MGSAWRTRARENVVSRRADPPESIGGETMTEPKDHLHPATLRRMIEYSLPGAQQVSPAALMRMIEYIIPEARQVSPVATMLLILARRELITHLPTSDGVVTPFRRQ